MSQILGPSAAEPCGPQASDRNLIVCCDGTGNVWGNQRDTNVVKLVRLCIKDERQLVYYDPGVGTATDLPTVDGIDLLLSKLSLLSGLAFGRGVYENIAQAYAFLIHHYRPGDRIFLFGFSRGAFTVRCIGGLMHLYGIVRPSAAPLVPSMLRNYFARDALSRAARHSRRAFAQDIRDNFVDPAGLAAEVHFLGVWDTVASVGGLHSTRMSTDPSLKGKPYRYVRHAVSEGEYRAAYAPRLYHGKLQDEPTGSGAEREASLKQLWFPGVHSDVGGSYKEAGLSDIALQWMLDEAEPQGLRLDRQQPGKRWPRPDAQSVAHDQALVSPLWALSGLQRRPPPPPAQRHESLLARDHDPQLQVEPRLRFPRHRWLWGSLAACIAAYQLMVGNTPWIGPAPLTPLQLARLQLGAAWLPPSVWRNYRQGFALALASDCLFAVAYTCLACTLVVYAVRALRNFRVRDAPFHERLRFVTTSALRVTPCCDLGENLFTYLLLHHTAQPSSDGALGLDTLWAVSLAVSSMLKWAGAGALVAVCTFAASWALYARAPRLRQAAAGAPAD